MRKAFGSYRRLARGAVSCSSLWAGDEHILYVKGGGFPVPLFEEYHRFVYRDIRGLTWAPTATGMIITIILGVSLILFGTPTAILAGAVLDADVMTQDRALAIVGLVFLGPAALIVAAGLVIHLVLGPSSVMQIETDAGATRIRPGRRVKTARRIAAEIAAIMAERQAPPPAAEMPPAAEGTPAQGGSPQFGDADHP